MNKLAQRWLMVVFASTLLWASLGRADPPARVRVENPLGFSLNVPAEFTVESSLVAQNPTLLHAYVRRNPPDETPVFILVEKLKGVIGREQLSTSKAPKNPSVRIFTIPWNNFTIDAFEVPETIDGNECVTFNAQVPLKPNAIQLSVFGPASRNAELLLLLKETVALIQGPSNWIGSLLPVFISDSSSYGTALLVVAFAAIAIGLVVLWIAMRRKPKGSLLLAGALILLISWLLPQGNYREWRVIRGSASLFGTGAILLGLADFLIPRTRKVDKFVPPPEAPAT
jgi:hypothetical protein